MHLLVSVANAEEAAAALAGGADIIDAKNPAAGALGAVPGRVFREIRSVVGMARPVTAALGDASDGIAIERAARVKAVAFEDLLEAAALGGAEGVLVDTADKRGPGLRQLVTASTLTRWIADAHDAGMFIAVSGKLTADDLPFARDAGADIAGVRGAACLSGRTSAISAERVRLLARALHGGDEDIDLVDRHTR